MYKYPILEQPRLNIKTNKMNLERFLKWNANDCMKFKHANA